MSRMDKFGSRASTSATKFALQQHTEGTENQNKLPPRHIKHPSNRYKLSKWFYNSLIIIFMLLVAGLLMWGKSFTLE